MEREPSEKCTGGAKTHVQKALLGQGPLRQVLSPCSQTEGEKREGKGDDTRVFKSSFLSSCAFAQCFRQKMYSVYHTTKGSSM